MASPHSDDEFSHSSPSGTTTRDFTASSSPKNMVERPRKRVEWRLGEGPSDAAEQSTPARPLQPPPVADEERSSSNAPAITKQATDDELRQGIYEIFDRYPPSGSSPARGGSIDNGGEGPSRPPKSAMRSGTSTPVFHVSPPSEQADGDIYDEQGKTHSANVAKDKADRLSKSLAYDSRPPSRSAWAKVLHPHQTKRANSHSRTLSQALYHDGDDVLTSGQTTPAGGDDYDYVPTPSRYRTTGLTSKLLLDNHTARYDSIDESSTGASTPNLLDAYRSMFHKQPRNSMGSLAGLINASTPQFTSMVGPEMEQSLADHAKPVRPGYWRSNSSGAIEGGSPHLKPDALRNSSANLLAGVSKGMRKALINEPETEERREAKRKKSEARAAQIRIQKHIKETRTRQRYLLKICRALMEYGAPTHRLEEYMKMSSRVLDIQAQYLYIPGCMVVAFDDPASHTTEMKLVRVSQGIDLGKLRDAHDVYKLVVHDEIGVDEAIDQLDEIADKPLKYNIWFQVFMHGIASACVAPYAFEARLVDLPIAFILGLILGFLRLIWAAKSDLYTAIFEVASVIVTSFLSRAFGSINYGDGRLFCFSALAQSSIALILPGYIVLCGALELQTKSIVAGSVRIVYAVLYSLFIGFGLTIGSAIYGLLDSDAVSAASCSDPLPSYWPFFFVPPFAVALMIINGAKWKQMPVMTIIAFAGYIINYFSSKRFQGNASVSAALAALGISVLANTYSRLGSRFDKAFEAAFSWAHSRVVRGRPGFESIELPDLEKQSKEAGVGLRANVVTPEDLQNDESAHLTGGHSRTGSEATIAVADTPPRPYAGTPDSEPGSPGHSRPPSYHDHDGTHDVPPPSASQAPKPKKTRVRVNYSLAAAAMLPAIFVLVPSGLAVSGSLVQGIQTANEITSNSTASSTLTSSDVTSGNLTNSVAFTVGLSVVQIAVGITVGLFLGTLVVYPLGKGGLLGGSGKMRSGLFTF